MDTEQFKTLLVQIAHELDQCWGQIDQEWRCRGDPPDKDRIALVEQIESIIDYKFANRS